MTEKSQPSLEFITIGYGDGGYGGGYYGGISGNDETMTELYEEFGDRLAADLNDVQNRLNELDTAIDQIDTGGGGGVSEKRVEEITKTKIQPLIAQISNSTGELKELQSRLDDLDENDGATLEDVRALLDDRMADVRGDLEQYKQTLAEMNGRLTAAENALNDLGDRDGIGEAREAAIDRELYNLKIIGRPKHRATISTGVPGGEFHPFGDWGMVITVHEDVRWKSAVVDVEEPGKTRLLIEEMNYDEGATYELGDVHASIELTHREAGIQSISPNVVLPKGQYFITRDTDMVVPMRRVITDVDWENFNQGHNVPVSVECSWRARANYKPGTSDFQRYRENNWHRRFYYFADMEFSFMSALDKSEG